MVYGDVYGERDENNENLMKKAGAFVNVPEFIKSICLCVCMCLCVFVHLGINVDYFSG